MVMIKFSGDSKEQYHFFVYLFSKFFSTLGNSIYNFGISFYILSFTGSSFLFSLNLVAAVLPNILFSLISGYAADRFNKKKIVIGFQIINILVVSTLLVIFHLFEINLVAIYITTAILSLTSSFIRTTFTSSIRNLFSEKNVQKVLGLNQSTLAFAGILGPVIGGIVYGLMGNEVFLICFIIGYMVSVLLDSTLNFNLYNTETKQQENVNVSMMQSIRSGLKYTFGSKIISSLILVALFANFFGSGLIVGLNTILIDHFQMEAHYVGSIESTIAIGTMVGGLLISLMKNFRNPLKISKGGLIGMGGIILGISIPFFVTMSNLQILFTYGVLLFAFGVINQFANTPMFVFLQKTVDSNYLGRVFSLLEMNAMILTPLSYIIFGILFDMNMYRGILITSGTLTIISVLCILRPSILILGSSDEVQKNQENIRVNANANT
jgi:MFS transporter, DHA3 family, macrolide efflux protein